MVEPAAGRGDESEVKAKAESVEARGSQTLTEPE